MNKASKSRQRGLTLVESLVSLGVCVTALGSAVPGLDHLRARQHLVGATAQLQTELAYARSLAVARNQTVHVGFESSGAATCYVIHSGKPGDCTCIAGPAVCQPGAEALRSVKHDSAAAVSVRSNSRSIGFSPHNGTVTPTATMATTNRRGEELRLVINIMGRVRSCTPSAGLPEYARC